MSSQTIGIIGAGNIGSQLARLAVRTGHDVVIANSRGPETLADLVAELGDHARAGTREEAAEAGEVVIVSTPLTAVETLPVEPLVGKVVIDTNNYYPHRDGHIRALDDETTTSSELLQERLVGARVVKAFNHIGARFLTKDARPAGAEWRPW
jgi:predicted dinucleotide-binding enzyme